MPTSTMDFSQARSFMVDSQVRPNKVNDPRILGAMRSLPRERFAPAASAALAYADENVMLAPGRVMLAPMTIARLIQALAPMQGERALVVGAGTGYGAAVLAACGPQVTALEEDPDLADRGTAALAECAPAVQLVRGKLADGLRDGAPWDIIMIEGAVRGAPESIARQLRREGGRLVMVRGGTGRQAQAVIGEASSAGLGLQPLFDCAAPLLAALLPAPGFVF